MGFFKKLFGNDTKNKGKKVAIDRINSSKESEYENIPGFIETDQSEYELVSVVASAVAAGDNPDSTFTIKKILKRNPEVTLVSAIALSLAAGDSPDSQFTIQSIKKRKTTKEGGF